MPNDTLQRCAVLTGAAGGIGRACLARLAGDGWTVLAVDARPPDGLDAEGAAGRIETLQADIAAPGAAEQIVEHAFRGAGRIDLLVNNAGIGNARPVHETSDEELDRFMAVNFAAAFRLSREALKRMRPGACIIHIASVLALRGTPATSSYVASKAALAGLTRQMAAEYGPRGIRTNAIAPGLIETPLTAGRLAGDASFRRLWADATPWPRLGRAEDIAAAVRFLASPDAEFINGHVLVVDGGWSVAAPGAAG